MRCFLPDIRLAAELPEQPKLEEKFGGVRGVCRRSAGRSVRIATSTSRSSPSWSTTRPGSIWAGGPGAVRVSVQSPSRHVRVVDRRKSGANACFVLEPEELTEELAPMPEDAPPRDLEVRVVGWREMDDGVTEDKALQFFSRDDYAELPEELLAKVPSVTHLGGVPRGYKALMRPRGTAGIPRAAGQSLQLFHPADGQSFRCLSQPAEVSGPVAHRPGPQLRRCGHGLHFSERQR